MRGRRLKITPEQLINFLKWEQDHQLKLFPWMEESDVNAGKDHGKLREEGCSGTAWAGGRGVDPNEDF